MAARVWITEIKFSDNTVISFDKDVIVVFVGPNNAGKSASLKETAKLLRARTNAGKVIKSIDFEKEGDESNFLNFLEEHSIKKDSGTPQPHFQGFGYNIYGQNGKNAWNSYKNGIGELFSLFANVLTTEQRINAANPPSNIRLTSDPIQHPSHFLQKDDNLEERFSNYFRQAFGKDLIVHRNAGSIVPLYVGNKPIPQGNEDRVSANYLKELEKLDLLHEQGDGMRSFVGVLLNVYCYFFLITN